MSTLSWNVHGAGCKDFKNRLRLLVKSHDSDILILMEAKTCH